MESSDDDESSGNESLNHDSDNFMSYPEGHSSPMSSPLTLSENEEYLSSNEHHHYQTKANDKSDEARKFLAARNATPAIKNTAKNKNDEESDFELEILPPVQETKAPPRQILKQISALSGRPLPVPKVHVTEEVLKKPPTNSKDLIQHLIYAQQKQIQEDREERIKQYKKLSSGIGKAQDSEEKKALDEYENSLLWEKAKKKAAMIRKQEKQKEREMMLKKKEEEDLDEDYKYEGDESDVEEDEYDDEGAQPMEINDYSDEQNDNDNVNQDNIEKTSEQEDSASNSDEEFKLPDDHRLKHRTTKRRVVFDDDEDEDSSLVIKSPSQIVPQDDNSTQTTLSTPTQQQKVLVLPWE